LISNNKTKLKKQ